MVVAVAPDHTVAELVAALAELLDDDPGSPLTVIRTGEHHPPFATLGSIDLLDGDRLRLGPTDQIQPPPPLTSGRLVLDIVSGPQAGRSFVLAEGRTTIGRGGAVDISLDDRSVSRRHATVDVDVERNVTITVLGRDDRPRPWPPGVDRTFGSTRMVVRVDNTVYAATPGRFGRLDHRRGPQRAASSPPREVFTVGPMPTRPQPRRLHVIGVAVPLVVGLAMFALTGHAQFLLFTLISPAVMVGTAIEDRRAGRRSFADEIHELHAEFDRRRDELERRASRERDDRLSASPDLADLVRRATTRSGDLWPRRRESADAGRLRLGSGDDRASFEIEIEGGGDPQLRSEAIAHFHGVDRLAGVPVTHDLTGSVLGIHGPADLVEGVAAAAIVQLATLHGPADLVMAVAADASRGLGWVKWLPHTGSATSDVPGPLVATTSAAATDLATRLTTLARRSDRHEGPLVVVIVDARLRVDVRVWATMLRLVPTSGLGVLWLADNTTDLPHRAGSVLTLGTDIIRRSRALLWSTEPSTPDRELDAETLDGSVASDVARHLAPLDDPTTPPHARQLPRTVTLFDVLGGRPRPDAIATRWRSNAGRHRLGCTIGLGIDGPVTADLVADGPHTLIGGTSGAGKSELLMSLVAQLAVDHSPEQLTFLFVDYKGGAASHAFARLPHTVGTVTNLTAGLARRALTSLRAELAFRMALLHGRAGDLAEMIIRHPQHAPPSLVIVVDEFATLIQEIPEFVPGIIDIARRGRSLGIHLVLATQRPSGAIDDEILANTNLRIALRVLDRAESIAIIDRPDAAGLPGEERGRGFVRRVGTTPIAFQAAHTSAAPNLCRREPVRAARFEHPDDRPHQVRVPGDLGDTQLAVTIQALVDAAAGVTPPRRPWHDPLPSIVTLDELWDHPNLDGVRDRPGFVVPLGMIDHPEQQAQHPVAVDLAARGGLIVVGGSGSGVTQLLRTVAVALDRGAEGGSRVECVVFSPVGDLADLTSLQGVVAVASDTESITRHLTALDHEIDRRRRTGADHHPVVVLIDGVLGLLSAIRDQGRPTDDRWTNLLERIVVEGRRDGVYTVATSHRRHGIPTAILTTIGVRLVLRQTDPHAYLDLGVRPELGDALDTPGRALLDGRDLVQIAFTRTPGDRRSPNTTRPATADRPGGALVAVRLPDDGWVPYPEDWDGSKGTPIGITDVTGRWATIDVGGSHVAVVGPRGSGRTNALAVFAERFVGGRLSIVGSAVGAHRGPIVPGGGRTVDAVGAELDRIASLATASLDQLHVVVVDDLDRIDEPALFPAWERLLAIASVRVVAAIETRTALGYLPGPVGAVLASAHQTLVLRPDDSAEFMRITGTRLPDRPGLGWVSGRGVLVTGGSSAIVQVSRQPSRSAP